MPVTRRRVALVGTGHRGTITWGQQLLADCGEWVELVGLSDRNRARLQRATEAIGGSIPTFTDLAAMLAATDPDTLIVATRDDTHAGLIEMALEAGFDVVTEKPMATTVATVARILEMEKRSGKRVDVAFNYRFSPTARRIKELLNVGTIGEIVSVDFHWYLDVRHGADYFRRWHARLEYSGGLFVHKATHHFDLLNWYLADDPSEVFARGELRHYGKRGPFRGVRCKGCQHAGVCEHYVDIGRDPLLDLLYEDPAIEDGYVRDACVFREEIDIPDAMSAAILYANGVQVAYSLNTFMPIEGYHLAFNGQRGRIEIRQQDRQPWSAPPHDEIVVMRNDGPIERIKVQHESGSHFGGDAALQKMLFAPGMKDDLGQRAGTRAGAASVLCGLAAMESIRTGLPVRPAALLNFMAERASPRFGA